jgi:hypothetical protein
MTFEEQARQAVKMVARDTRFYWTKIIAVCVVTVGVAVFLLTSALVAKSQRNQVSGKLYNFETEAQTQIDMLSQQLVESREQLDKANQAVGRLEIQNEELKKVTGKAQRMELDLTDAYAELDILDDKVKMLELENRKLKAALSGSHNEGQAVFHY